MLLILYKWAKFMVATGTVYILNRWQSAQLKVNAAETSDSQ